ncbi:cyclic nucleotide-binding domain protein (macronuclear) [Tetrahymena thermophila SB210]|uniref:Cyclic nucleotide-binding domain protein n=1 Tax=Tetrahymena thermophila (strain SB210) TaxID=312017 RepID=Q245E2_TETTS|nr:cyclic nucleotide-binding domain protein [Tetrahymena thermophila SB210]EAS03422.2 cyclic nucleotide-binding domain protein [Tetrahymena thermophila SB210]|eukprot:XP_001023667.2 cyclic nucleotide-binding domain protein [Tetrahymena thermophila SB210]
MSSHFSLQQEKVINEPNSVLPKNNNAQIQKDKRGSVHLRLFKLMLGRSLLNVLQDDKCTKLFNMQIQKENYMRKIVNKKIVSLKVEEDQDMVLTIIKKSYKNKFEQQFLINAIKDLDFFEKNTFLLEQQHKLSNIINIKSVQKGTILLEIGDSCSCYFIIVKGLVYGMHPKLRAFKRKQNKKNSVVFNSQQNGTSQIEKQGTQDVDAQNIPLLAKQESFSINQNHINSNTPKNSPKAKLLFRQQSKSLFNESPLSIPQMFPHMDILQTYKPGDSFGQVFLLSNSVSEMTFVCGEDCEFLTISKQDYEELVGIQREQILRQKLEFLEKFDIFYNFTNIMLLHILELMQIQKLDKNQVIFKQGEECKYIYFIRQGEVRISFTYTPETYQSDIKLAQSKLSSKQQEEESPQNVQQETYKEKQNKNKKRFSQSQSTADDKTDQIDQNQAISKKINQNEIQSDQEILKTLELQSKQVKNSLLTQYNSNLGRKTTKVLDIIILSQNTYFGEEDIISNQQIRNYTATCQSSQTEIFRIDAQRLIKILKIQNTYKKMIQTQKTKTSWYVQRRNELVQFCQNQNSQKTHQNSGHQENQLIFKSLKNNFSEKDLKSFQKNIQSRRGSAINNHQTIFSNPFLSSINVPQAGSTNVIQKNSFSLTGIEEQRLKMNHQLFQEKLFTKDFQLESNRDFIPSKSSVSFNFIDNLYKNQDKSSAVSRNLKNFLSPQQKNFKQNMFSFSQKSQQKIETKRYTNLLSIKEQPSSLEQQKILNTQIFSLQSISKIEDPQLTVKDEEIFESKEKKSKKSKLKLQIKEKINEQANKSNFNEAFNLKEISPLKQHRKSFYSLAHSPDNKFLIDGFKFEKQLNEFTSPLAKGFLYKDNFIIQAKNQRKSVQQSPNFMPNSHNSQQFSLKSSIIISDDNKNKLEENQNVFDSNQQILYYPSTLQNLDSIPLLAKNKNRTFSLNPTSLTSSQVKSTSIQSDLDKTEQTQQNLQIKSYYISDNSKSQQNISQSISKLNQSSSRPKIFLNNSAKSIDTIQFENKNPLNKVSYIIQSSQNSRKNSYLNLNQDEQTFNQDQLQIPSKLADFDHIQSRNAQILQQYNKEKFGQRITNIFKLNKRLVNSNKEKVLNFLINKQSQVQ